LLPRGASPFLQAGPDGKFAEPQKTVSSRTAIAIVATTLLVAVAGIAGLALRSAATAKTTAASATTPAAVVETFAFAAPTFAIPPGNSSASSTSPGAIPSSVVQDQNFSATLPTGWSVVQDPKAANGGKGQAFLIASADDSIQGAVDIIDLNNTTASSSLVTQLETEDIKTLAMQWAGIPVGNTNIQLLEPVHPVTVAGEACAQLGNPSTHLDDAVYLSCRHHNVLYGVVLYSGPSSINQLDTLMTTIGSSWKWK
jgi:hypothetical protein